MVDGTIFQGRYRLERRLSSGGMGVVYVGLDERLHRRVAIKLLKDELADDPRFVERFRREARAVASLSHPTIANVYDYGQDADKHFIVMEFAPGRDLSLILETDAPLPVERAVKIGAQLCDALAHAHAAGVIHRDVKPANVIIDDGDHARVTDFGIARAAGDSTLTATGSVLGTAHYLSPEQAAGHELTPASDIYSAGVVMYEMLTGTVPFSGSSAIAVAMQHMNNDVGPPSDVNPDVPAALDALVQRATARPPEARFHSANEMAEALRQLSLQSTAANAPTRVAGAAPPPSAPTQPVWPAGGDRYHPRRVGRAVALTLITLALLAGALLAFRLLNDDSPRQGEGENPSEGPGPAEGNGSDQEATDPSEEETATPSPSPSGILISDGFIGANSKDVEQLLADQGVLVETIDQDSEEEKHTILAVDPPPGTTVGAGDTVTLTVSTGKVGDEGDDDD